MTYELKISRMEIERVRLFEVSSVSTSEGKKSDISKRVGTDGLRDCLRSLPPTLGPISFATYLSKTKKSEPTKNK